jgi:inorganic triphosphatase YgiF
MAFRIRRSQTAAGTQWIQTLKAGAHGDSALSTRGEWEHVVAYNAPEFEPLKNTAWTHLDPAGALFTDLRPVFCTTFERTIWNVRRRDGSCVELALDWGEVVVEGKATPLCELELELHAGAPEALFELARQIAEVVPLFPLHVSKAERAFQLATGALNAPVRASRSEIHLEMTVPEVAATVLRGTFHQFTANLNILRANHDVEVLHQARIGWRRFSGALKLFVKRDDRNKLPSFEALKPLLGAMGELRDLDVAMCETLPMLSGAFTTGAPRREDQWHELEQLLAEDIGRKRVELSERFADASTGQVLLAIAQWIECDLPQGRVLLRLAGKDLCASAWARRRLSALFEKLDSMPADSHDILLQHRIRILSKQLRYGIEALRVLLGKRRADYWYETANRLHADIGASRDLLQCIAITARLGAAPEIVGFLRGVAFGKGIYGQTHSSGEPLQPG